VPIKNKERREDDTQKHDFCFLPEPGHVGLTSGVLFDWPSDNDDDLLSEASADVFIHKRIS
jgi:hypothetical protein